MAKKYKLLENGVLDTETGAIIPPVEANKHWKKYQRWLAEGNEPEPQYTTEELEEKQLRDSISELEDDLQQVDRVLLKLIFTMYKVGVTNNLWKKSDFTAEVPDIVDKVQNFKAKLSELEGLRVTEGKKFRGQ